MKRLKPKQLGPWCSYCPPKTRRAVYRQDGFSGGFCCEDHKTSLHAAELVQQAQDSHITEADEQTWRKL